jgi:hypothetical protein
LELLCVWYNPLESLPLEALASLPRLDKHCSLIFEKFSPTGSAEQMQKMTEVIREFSFEKEEVEKITLVLKDGAITPELVKLIFIDPKKEKEKEREKEREKEKEKDAEKDGLAQSSRPKSRSLHKKISTRSSLFDDSKHMKINRISIENCEIEDSPEQQ